MVKKLRYVLLVLFVTLILPNPTYASSDSVGNGEQGRGLVPGSCKSTWMCQALDAAGVRFTFVDQNGVPIGGSGSYDFTTKTNGGYKGMVYNTGTGDKSKLTGKFVQGTTNIADLPKLSTLAGKMNWYMNTYDEYRSGKVSNISFSGDTGGNRLNMFKTETTWFNSMTTRGLSKETYTANVNAFMVALQDVYSTFNASAMKMQMVEGCNSGQEIYIQMEPLYTIFYGGDKGIFIFGTIRDIVTYYEGKGLGAKARDYMNGNNKFLWAIEYDRKIDSSNFTGYAPATSGSGYKLESINSLNDKVGYAVALDWANSPDGYCEQCVYKDGNMYYEDKLISTYEAPFKSLQEYVLSKKVDGGMNCCSALETELKAGRKLPEEWQKGYDEYCKKPDGGPGECKTKTVDGKTQYYCQDGEPCSQEKYKIECDPGDKDKCCTLDPIEAGWIDGDINNCCSDGTVSEAHEYDLDDLFCDYNGLGVKNFKEKCDADYYKESNTGLKEDYCNMYCTERVSVEIPGAITAVSGRYFKLEKTTHDTTSPYIEGYKRCRVVVQYQLWEEDYASIVQEQVDSYNRFQDDKANELMYDAALKTKETVKEKSNITCGCSCNYSTKCADGSSGCKSTAYAKSTSSCDITYSKYTFNKMYDINPVGIDTTKRNDEKNIYNAIEIVSKPSYKTTHAAWSAWDIEASIEACDKKLKSMEKSVSADGHCSCVLSCTRTTVEGEKHIEDVQKVKDNYATSANNANADFNTAADLAKDMETTIDKCSKYFTDYEGANAKDKYNFDVDQKFSYSQIYMNDEKKLALDEIFVEFANTPGCVVDEEVVLGPNEEDKLSGKQYSQNIYGEGTEKMSDFKNSTLAYQSSKTGFKNYIDSTYEAEKVFTTDARYHVICSWDEGDKSLYTLVPSGSVTESTGEMNYTLHGQEYRVYLTTLDGTYETKWHISGLGSKINNSDEGKFDKFFLKNGKTCANEKPKDNALLSCKIHSAYETVLTGYCNGSNDTDVTVALEDCDPYEKGYLLFNFKIVDPENLFPSGTKQKDGDIAYNWTSTDAGKNAMKDIQEHGSKDTTYAPERLSYSFVLTPSDMGHIKNYNASRYGEGGYGDFTLVCSKETCEDGACSECKSPFLENLAAGFVKYDDANHKVFGWSNAKKNLAEVREYYGWK